MTKVKVPKKPVSKQKIKDNVLLYALMSPVLIFILIFNYIPIYGIAIAFQDYVPGNPIISANTNWVGLKHFIKFAESEYFWRLIRNSIVLAGGALVVGFVCSLGFALLLNEVKQLKLKKFIQTSSYLPHFISAVVVASMTLALFSNNGLINNILALFGIGPVSLQTDPKAFPWIYVFVNVWMTFGWNSIIYMAGISSISPDLYEAAKLDGANRWKQMLHVTLPGIGGTIFVVLIFSVGSLLAANTEFILLLYNPATYETADVIGTYSYRIGILGNQYSLTTAIGLFMQIINFAILYGSNALSRRINGYSLW